MERELRRKDKALAETAALLVLKKKAQAIWGDEPPDSDALRAHVHFLRSALDQAGERPLLHTVRGIGDQLADPGGE